MRFASITVAAALAWSGLATASAAFEVLTETYACARGVEVPAAYVNAADGSAAILTVEGRQVALVAEPAASGARYGWPSGGSGYLWVTKGSEATLFWRDGAAGTETAILTDCRAG